MKNKRLVYPKGFGDVFKHTDKQLNKMTKKGLIRLIKKLEKIIIQIAYQKYKSKLPRLKPASELRQRALPRFRGYTKTGKRKKQFSPKQLAAQRLFTKRAKAGTLRRKR